MLFDDNAVTIDGSTGMSDDTDQLKRFKASGWNVARVDGHNMDAVRGALLAAQTADRPSLIACKTIIGYGAPKIAGTGPAHGGPYGAEEIAGIRTAIDWPHAPFVVPDEILQAWRKIGAQGARHREAWDEAPRRVRQARRRSKRRCRASCPKASRRAINAHKKKVVEAPEGRRHAQMVRRCAGNR